MALFKRQPFTQPNLSILLSEFNRSLMLIVDKSLLIHNFVAKVRQICSVDSVYIFLLDESTGKYRLQNPEDKQGIVLTGKDKLIHWLSVNEKELVLSRHPDIVGYFSEREQAICKQLKTELIYPLKIMNHINGRDLILETLRKHGYNRTLTAEALNISRKTLFNKMKRHGLDS
ncbi:MAG: hypothetical protein LBQ73_03605 [Tannerellaceae bacterium]|nr:hypothetical protein [Tannerellaceae bacterium]